MLRSGNVSQSVRVRKREGGREGERERGRREGRRVDSKTTGSDAFAERDSTRAFWTFGLWRVKVQDTHWLLGSRMCLDVRVRSVA